MTATARWPADQLVTCTRTPGTANLVEQPVLVVEVLSPASGQTDRILKVREHAAIPTMLRYLIVEPTAIGLQLLQRNAAGEPWRTTALAERDTLALPDLAIEVPIAEFYENVDFTAQPAAPG